MGYAKSPVAQVVAMIALVLIVGTQMIIGIEVQKLKRSWDTDLDPDGNLQEQVFTGFLIGGHNQDISGINTGGINIQNILLDSHADDEREEQQGGHLLSLFPTKECSNGTGCKGGTLVSSRFDS